MTGIVYVAISIYRCFNLANSNQNTSIKNQKSTRGKQIDTKANKPIPNKSTESYGQKTRHFQKQQY